MTEKELNEIKCYFPMSKFPQLEAKNIISQVKKHIVCLALLGPQTTIALI